MASLAFALLLLPVVACTKGYTELLAAIFKDYDARARPSNDPTKPTLINITVTLINILNVVSRSC